MLDPSRSATRSRMRRALVGVLVVAILAAGCRGDATAQLPPLAPDARILAFGDSLTFGTGAARPTRAIPRSSSRLLGRAIVRIGRARRDQRAGSRAAAARARRAWIRTSCCCASAATTSCAGSSVRAHRGESRAR